MNMPRQNYLDQVPNQTKQIKFVTQILFLQEFVPNYNYQLKKYMPRRFPEWVNTAVVVKAIKMREEGTLSKQLNLWIENLLEIEKK